LELFKSLVAYFLTPYGLALIAISLAWVAKYKHRERLATKMWVVATLMLTLGALSGFTYGTRRAKEYQYQPLRITADDTLLEAPSTIVVLGAGFNADDYLPANSRVSSAYLARLLEGVRIYRQLPQSKLVISVAGKADVEAKQQFLDEMAELLQLDMTRIQLITHAESTDDEAQSIEQMHQGEAVILVSSAGHMPRAMQIFAANDLPVQAAPADFGFTRSASPNDKPWQRWIPSLDGLGSNAQFMYEAVATLASKIK